MCQEITRRKRKQIAAVLTYVRREWGQTASPVAPEAVAAIRKTTAARPRPWTNEELSKLVAGPGLLAHGEQVAVAGAYTAEAGL